jgi:SPP1 gp7 family putative phage head morphogenesis protein
MSDENEKAQENESEKAGEQTADSGGAGKTYAQAELDRMFAERARQAESSLLKKLGFEKAEDALAALNKLKTIEDGQKSDLQKAQDKIAELTKSNADLSEKQKSQIAQYEVALGWNPRKTALAMVDGLAQGLDKALLIARTEQIRAYRESTRAEYAARGVEQYQRHCSKSDRTCPVCLALDGEVYPVNELMPSHPGCRCFMTRYTGEKSDYQNAQDWFAGLKEERQREILGRGHFELYQKGVPLREFVKVTDDPVWGPTLGLKPLKEILLDKPLTTQFPSSAKRFLSLGNINPDILENWDYLTGETILTDERAKHILNRHPDMQGYQNKISQIILNPTFVHRNTRDKSMAIFYYEFNDKKYLRVAVWISDNAELKNSIHSMRMARNKEIENGRKAGREVWKK